MEFLALIETEIKKTRKMLIDPGMDNKRVEDWLQVLRAFEDMWHSQYRIVKQRGLL